MVAVLLALSATAFTQTVPKNLIVIAHAVSDQNTKVSRAGEYVLLKSTEPLEADGKVLAPVGSWVIAHITKLVPPGKKNCRDGEIEAKIDAIQLPSGDWALLTNAKYEEAYDDSRGNHVAVKKARGLARPMLKHAAENVGAASLFVALLPIAIPFEIAVTEANRCGSSPGKDTWLGEQAAKTTGKLDNRWSATLQKLQSASMVKSEHQ